MYVYYISANVNFIFKLFQNHQNWTVAQWRWVIISDEKTFQVGHSDQIFVWRPARECFTRRYMADKLKSGRFAVAVWWCMSGHGSMAITRINGHLDQHQYINILQNTMLAASQQRFPNNFILQQDRSSVHTANRVTAFLQNNVTMNWPPKGPGMSPIENVWAEMVRILEDQPLVQDANQLWQQIQAGWTTLSQWPPYWHTLLLSMPRWMAAAVSNGGHWSKY